MLVACHGAACGDWSTGLIRGSHGCGLRKGIMFGWDRVRLWHDLWCGDVVLKEAFLYLSVPLTRQPQLVRWWFMRMVGWIGM